MRQKDSSWARSSLLISLAVHGIVFIFLAMYVTGAVQKVKELVNATLVQAPKSDKYVPRPQPVKPIVRPDVPRAKVVDSDSIPVDTSKRSSPIPGRGAKTSALPRFSEETIQNVVSPSSLTRSRIAPMVTTAAKVLPSDLVLPPSVAGGASGPGGIGTQPGTGGSGLGGSGGGHGRAAIAAARSSSVGQSLSMINVHTALSVDDELSDVAKGVTLSTQPFPPLPRGEPGGIVIGRGKDIKGHIRFTRLKHRLADWWSDPTSMPAVMYWMNTRTPIHADMNIEGGALTLDSPVLPRCPLVIMTGHDRAILTTSIQGHYVNKFTDQEKTGLRRYLIEAGGLFFFDDCGHDGMLARMLKNELRATVPEHSVEWIPNNHELYSCYYDLGGPPPGAERFWKHGVRPPVRTKKLEGLFINERLAAVISNRDYLCAARTENRPGHGNTGEESPSAYRFLTNVIIYSLISGNISEHSGYAPDLTDADRISIDSPVPVPILIPQ